MAGPPGAVPHEAPGPRSDSAATHVEERKGPARTRVRFPAPPQRRRPRGSTLGLRLCVELSCGDREGLRASGPPQVGRSGSLRTVATLAVFLDTDGMFVLPKLVFRWMAAGFVALMLLTWAAPAHAHQPVPLNASDSTPARGPLLVDGTVSFAVYATVRKGTMRGFRFGLKAADQLALQLLIPDSSPVNHLSVAELPIVTVIDPTGKSTTMPITERTPFFEPYSGTSYLYLSRLTERARAGTYQVTVTGNSSMKVPVVVAVGYREVRGTVLN